MTLGKAITAAVAILLFIAPGAARAEPVSINLGTGLGFIFNHKGNCYVVLPEHVHGRRRSLSLRTAAPSAFGEARVFKSFVPGRDLSIGLVTAGLTDRCSESWSDLPARTDALLDRTDSAVLVRVAASGAEERIPMRISNRDFDTLTASIAGDGGAKEIYQGTSGGVLVIDDRIVGMAIEASDTRQARFLRIDEIKSALDRLIEARGEGRDDAAGTADDQAPAPVAGAAAVCAVPAALPLRNVSCDAEPLAPERGCNNLAAASATVPTVLPPSSAAALVAELAGSAAQPIERIVLSKDGTDDDTTAPKAIEVDVDSSKEGPPRWRRFGTADMTPLGAMQIANGSGPFARRIRVSIRSSWDPTKPIRLDCLRVVAAPSPVSR